MSRIFLSRVVRPSMGMMVGLVVGEGTPGAVHRNGFATGRSFFVGVRKLLLSFGGEGDVGGDTCSTGCGRPMMLAISDRLSGDLRRDSSSSPDSLSVTVSPDVLS